MMGYGQGGYPLQRGCLCNSASPYVRINLNPESLCQNMDMAGGRKSTA